MNLNHVNRLRVAVVAAASLLVGACGTETTSDESAPSETLAQAEEALMCSECPDVADDAYESCMRRGYAKPKTGSCDGPESATKPKWCAGLVELCGIPTPGCLGPSCMRLNQACAATYAPALDPTCDDVAEAAEQSCASDCDNPELLECIGTIDGEIIVVGTIDPDGWCRDDIGNGVDCTYGPPAECSLAIPT